MVPRSAAHRPFWGRCGNSTFSYGFWRVVFPPPSTPPPADSHLILRLMTGCWFGGRFEAQDRHLMVPELLSGGVGGSEMSRGFSQSRLRMERSGKERKGKKRKTKERKERKQQERKGKGEGKGRAVAHTDPEKFWGTCFRGRFPYVFFIFGSVWRPANLLVFAFLDRRMPMSMRFHILNQG